jgi:hypothetical protein
MRYTISLPETVAESAKKRAKSIGATFSGYIRKKLLEDIENGK